MLKITHTKDKHDNNKISIQGLQVIVSGDDNDGWFAQGVEINYFSCGWSLDEVMNNFAVGLGYTINEHLERYSSVEKLLKWSAWPVVEEVITGRNDFRTIAHAELPPDTGQSFPYDRLSFISKEVRAAA